MTSVDTRVRYARIARIYDLLDAPLEPLYARGRQLIGAEAVGLTLELGAGSGKNFAYYRPGARVIAADLSWAMLNRARRRTGPHVRGLLIADAARLPLRAESVETVTATFVCCVQVDPRHALHEIERVLRPGGRAMFLEYRLPPGGWLRWLLHVLEPPLRALYGVHWGQDLGALLQEAGLRTIDMRYVWGPLIALIRAGKLR